MKKRIALIAHDNKKRELIEWTKYNRDIMLKCDVIATGTTGRMLENELGIKVRCLQSGPTWWRSANWCIDCGRKCGCLNIFLGSVRATAS